MIRLLASDAALPICESLGFAAMNNSYINNIAINSN